jgi:hypothetical protein
MEETRSPREATDAAPEETRSPVSTPRTRLFRARRRRNVQIVPLPVTLAEIERFEKAAPHFTNDARAVLGTRLNGKSLSDQILEAKLLNFPVHALKAIRCHSETLLSSRRRPAHLLDARSWTALALPTRET